VSPRELFYWLRLKWRVWMLLKSRPCPCGGTIVDHPSKDLPGGGVQFGGAVCGSCGFCANMSWSDEQLRGFWEKSPWRRGGWMDKPDEYMCPNCVTPWKCNGPHSPESVPR
jgi:hypothetical protein